MVFDWKDKNGWMADYVAGNLSEYPVGLQVHLDLKEEDLWIHELRLKIPYSNIHQISNQTGPTIRNWGRTVTGFVVGGILGGFFGGIEEKQYMVLAYTTTENNEIMLAFDVKSLAKVQRELFNRVIKAQQPMEQKDMMKEKVKEVTRYVHGKKIKRWFLMEV